MLDELRQLGFTQNEARVYLAVLAQSQGATGYDLSRRSGVSRSMVYDVLDRLAQRGAVYRVPGEPVTYAPVAPAEYLDRLRRNHAELVDRIQERLSSFAPIGPASVVWTVQGYENALAEAFELLRRADHLLLLSIWQEHLGVLERELRGASERGVKVRMVLFSHERPSPRFDSTYLHNFIEPETVEARLKGKLAVIARDHQEVLIGKIAAGRPSWAIRSKDEALVLVSEEYVRHDVILSEMTRQHGCEILDRVWRGDEDLSEMVLGKE